MCGIAGWLDIAGRQRADTETVQRLLRHRGPDASEVEFVDGATLIHTRLSVLDLSLTGRQPAWSADRSVCVIFNGEIYNHRTLRRDLEARGHHLVGTADTSVIAPLYLEYGLDFADHLRGMFAIALYDVARRRLVLTRDRYGIKPLFFGRLHGAVAFASELPALRLVKGLDLTIDAQAVHDYLALHHIPPPLTIHRGVRAVEPGTQVIVDGSTCDLRVRRYHAFAFDARDDLDLASATEVAGRLLNSAVASQLESDVALGALLSGGIDSSLICEAADRQVGGIATFGVSFADAAFDERAAFERVAADIGSTHETLHFGDRPPTWDDICSLLLATGQPFADSSIFAVDALSALVRSRVTVALSGDGGDEAFGGYDHFGRLHPFAAMLRVPRMVRSRAGGVASAVARFGSPGPRRRTAMHLTHRFSDVAGARTIAEVVADQGTWLRPAEHRAMWNGPAVEPTVRLFEPTWRGADGGSTLDRLFRAMTEADTRIRLAGDYLPKVDIASMRHSLEVRVPFLDEDLFAFGLSLPPALTYPRGGPGKRVLRSLASQRVPSIAGLPKHGFGVPFDRWISAEVHERIDDLQAQGSRIHDWVDRGATAPLLRAFREGRVPDGLTRQGTYQRIVMLLALEVHLDELHA